MVAIWDFAVYLRKCKRDMAIWLHYALFLLGEYYVIHITFSVKFGEIYDGNLCLVLDNSQ